ncbi:efflux RND transporter periplasmic adaptor subunit [Mucisphaera sp.]|uniref:efflux RND transporter periplasmic adaptor subunit n=1 Tax=Mucisphaera sp. TaxID=2913024 RepID=UPI003D09CD11
MAATDSEQSGSWFLRILVVLLLIFGATFFGFDFGDAQEGEGVSAGDWFTVERQDLDLTFVATGELESRDRIEIKCEVNGRATISYIIDEGTRVEAGEVLVRLDDQEIRERIESQELEVETATLNLTTAERELEIQRNEAESAQKNAEVKLASARLDFEKWQRGDVPQRRRTLQLELDKAQRNVVRTARDYELSRDLYDQNFISLNELEDSEIDEIEAREALDSAKLDIEIYENYELVKQRQEKETAVEQAEAELEREIAKNEARLARYESDVRSKRRQLELRQEALAEAKAQLEKTVIVAPSPGLVVYASSVGPDWRRGDPMAVGREVRNNESLIFLPDVSVMDAVLDVHEALLTRVEVGQRAVVRIQARPGQPVEGRVSVIGVTADDGGWLNRDLRQYKVRVQLPDGFDTTLKPAMRLSAEIFTDRVEDEVVVPIQSVLVEGDRSFVFVSAGGGRVQRQAVETGRSNDTMVELVSGVEEGTRVLLRRPRPGEELQVATEEAEDGEVESAA